MYQDFYDILHKEVKPALGCTGPLGPVYAAASAMSILGGKDIKHIHIRGSKNTVGRNADVGIPGVSKTGIPMAVCIGAVGGDAGAGLEVLRNVTPEQKEIAERLADSGIVDVEMDLSINGRYVELELETENGTSKVIVATEVDNVVYQEVNGRVLLDKPYDIKKLNDHSKALIRRHTVKECFEFAKNCPIEDLYFLRDMVSYNSKMADHALQSDTGAGIGRGLLEIDPDDMLMRAKAYAAAGCETRMAGVQLTAMSVCNKGNVGLASSLPLVSMADSMKVGEEVLLRAVALSCLVSIMTISNIGKSPAMCSCMVSAALGVACGLVLMMDGSYEQVQYAFSNTFVNSFGVVCDGARQACAMRLAVGTGVAVDAARLAMKNVHLPFNLGVLGVDMEDSLRFLGVIGQGPMIATDVALCEALFEKAPMSKK